MRRMLSWFMITALSVLSDSASDVGESSVLTAEAREKIRALAHPYLMDILLPEQLDAARIPVSSVPERTTKEAAVWIRRVIEAKWLPPNIEGKLLALKDVKQWEKRDTNGVLISERIGDFLALEYEVSGYAVHVQESGVSVSLRVDFRQPRSVGDDPGAFIRECLRDFLNLSEDQVSQLQGDVKQESPVYYGYLRSLRVIEWELTLRKLAVQRPSGQSFEMNGELEERARQRQWWDRVRVCTDGRFFFVSVTEVEPGSNPRAKGGLPDRF